MWGGGGGGELEGVTADISYPLKYLFRFKISTNDSGTQRKFLSRCWSMKENLIMFFL